MVEWKGNKYQKEMINDLRAAGPLVIARQASIRKIMGVTVTDLAIERGIKAVAEYTIRQERAEIAAEIKQLKARQAALKPLKEVKRLR